MTSGKRYKERLSLNAYNDSSNEADNSTQNCVTADFDFPHDNFWFSEGLLKVDWESVIYQNLNFMDMGSRDCENFISKSARYSINPMIPITHVVIVRNYYFAFARKKKQKPSRSFFAKLKAALELLQNTHEKAENEEKKIDVQNQPGPSKTFQEKTKENCSIKSNENCPDENKSKETTTELYHSTEEQENRSSSTIKDTSNTAQEPQTTMKSNSVENQSGSSEILSFKRNTDPAEEAIKKLLKNNPEKLKKFMDKYEEIAEQEPIKSVQPFAEKPPLTPEEKKFELNLPFPYNGYK